MPHNKLDTAFKCGMNSGTLVSACQLPICSGESFIGVKDQNPKDLILRDLAVVFIPLSPNADSLGKLGTGIMPQNPKTVNVLLFGW